MFFRGHEQSKGSGLGLYIVKEALVKLSGSIRLESAPGHGSTFIVKLPKK
jgi:signal transduction histidine kinase